MRHRGLTMLEIVLAVGILFLCASFLMSMFLAGSSFPKRVDNQVAMDSLAQAKLDEVVGTDPMSPVSLPNPSSGTAGKYNWAVTSTPWAADNSMVELTAQVSDPDGNSVQVQALRPATPPDPTMRGQMLVNQLACLGCHSIQSGLGTAYPNWNRQNFVDGWNQYNAQNPPGFSSLDAYLRDSIQNPGSFVFNGNNPTNPFLDPTSGTSWMQAYGGTFGQLNNNDLNALVTYLKSLP